MRWILLIVVAISSLSCGSTVRELESPADAAASASPTPSINPSNGHFEL
jgi:hypothetical protein